MELTLLLLFFDSDMRSCLDSKHPVCKMFCLASKLYSDLREIGTNESNPVKTQTVSVLISVHSSQRLETLLGPISKTPLCDFKCCIQEYLHKGNSVSVLLHV